MSAQNTPPPSIQRHLLVTLTGAIVALFGIGALGIYFFMRHALYEQMDHHMERTAEDFIAETHRKPDGSVESGFHELELDDFGLEESATTAFYELRNSSGNSILRSRSLGDDANLPYVQIEPGEHLIESISLPGGTKARVIYAPFPLKLEEHDPADSGDAAEMAERTPEQIEFIETYDETAPENRALLSIAESLSPLRKTLAVLAMSLAVTGILLAAATFFIVRKIVAIACRPILHLSNMTESMGADSVDQSLPYDGVPRELRPLIEKFNDLLSRIDIAIRREKRFSMDIAHELRTPVSEMRTLLEVAASGDGSDDEDPQEIFRTGASISQRMSRIIETLTAVHQGNTGTIDKKIESTTLASVARAAIGNIATADQSRIDFLEKPGSDNAFDTDPELLRAVLDNLIGNSVTHSPPDSPITVSCDAVTVEICNEANNLSDSDLTRLHEPFWQKDPSRTELERFGLGLTLVDTYLRILGAKIVHRLQDGMLFTAVSFPDGTCDRRKVTPVGL